MESPENVQVCWHDYESHLYSSVLNLRNDSSFCDVTLICENNQVSAHKVILSSFSLTFKRILQENPQQHPLIYLRGVKMKDMTKVLDYMYSGEVEVAADDVGSLLEMFEEFEIMKEFDAQNHETKSSESRKRKSTEMSDTPPLKRESSTVPSTWISQDILDEMLITSEANVGSFKEGPIIREEEEVAEIDAHIEPIVVELPDYDRKEEITSLILPGFDKKYKCRECPYSTDDKKNLMGHIEARHLPGVYACTWPNCNKILKTRRAFRRHFKKVHTQEVTVVPAAENQTKPKE